MGFAMPDIADANKQKLVSDMKVVVSDAEEILRATAGVAGDKMQDLRERIGERLRDAIAHRRRRSRPGRQDQGRGAPPPTTT